MRLVAVPFRVCFGIDFALKSAWDGALSYGVENRCLETDPREIGERSQRFASVSEKFHHPILQRQFEASTQVIEIGPIHFIKRNPTYNDQPQGPFVFDRSPEGVF